MACRAKNSALRTVQGKANHDRNRFLASRDKSAPKTDQPCLGSDNQGPLFALEILKRCPGTTSKSSGLYAVVVAVTTAVLKI